MPVMRVLVHRSFRSRRHCFKGAMACSPSARMARGLLQSGGTSGDRLKGWGASKPPRRQGAGAVPFYRASSTSMGVFGHSLSVLVSAVASAGSMASFHLVLTVTQVVAYAQW